MTKVNKTPDLSDKRNDVAEEHSWLCPDQILIDPDVQRKFEAKHAASIARRYDPLMFGMGHVSVRADGKYYVLDGQHRCAAARQAGHGGIPVLFKIYRGLSSAEEAALFITLNANKKAVTALDTFRLNVKAGHPASCDISRIVESFGLRVAGYQLDGGISAVAALIAIYDGRLGTKPSTQLPSNGLPKGHLLSRTLHCLTTAWGKDHNAFYVLILRGVAGLMKKHGAAVDIQRLAKALSKSGTPTMATGRIRQLSEVSRRSASLAAVEYFENIYDHKHKREHRLNKDSDES